MSLFLDIETDYSQQITVIGFYERSHGFVQLVAPRISRTSLLRSLPKVERLYTFSGHCFDLPHIRNELGLNLRTRFKSIDLRYACKEVGWTGGQKAIEDLLGIRRKLPGVDGRYAQYLWHCHSVYGDEDALQQLLLYNREDVMNMVRIRAALRKAGILS
ncbi:MAG: Exonuclease-like protein [Candidatus Peregrinibacteria bacterium Greene0416_62]|nr:MAG: Exonuclease-like protein [Candidatus Peregrinibacteria bacterium Greene0416_62]